MRLAIILFSALLLQGMSLKQVYEESGPANGYDKYVELETGKIYTGGLRIGGIFNPLILDYQLFDDPKVKIVGNGAIVDLDGEELATYYNYNNLDIEDCVFINGNIRYTGATLNSGGHVLPKGSVDRVTLYKPHDYGVRIYKSGEDISVTNTIVVDPVETGDDFHHVNGNQMYWLPTGYSFNRSLFPQFGNPYLSGNHSYFSDPRVNEELINHYVRM